MALHGLVSARDLTSCFSLHFSWVLLFQSAHLRSCQEPSEKKSHRGSLHTFEPSTESPEEDLCSQPSCPRSRWQERPGPLKAPSSGRPVWERERFRVHWSPRGLQMPSSPRCMQGGSLPLLWGLLLLLGGARLWEPWSCGLWKAQAGRGTGGCPGGGCGCASQLTLPWERRAPSLSAAVGVDQVDQVSLLPRAGRLSAPLRRQGSVLTARGHPLACLPTHRRNGPRADAYPLFALP